MIRSRRHKNKRPFGSGRPAKTNASAATGRGTTKAVKPLRLTMSIALIGLMGSGKTTVGRRLAHSLGVGFVDSDQEIEKAAAMSVSEIFESYGEEEFRRVERQVIARLLKGRPKIIATGGGAFMNSDTRALMLEKALTVWLDADIDILVERTSRRDTRPLLKGGDPREILMKLAKDRNPVYAEATLRVQSENGPHEDVVAVCLQSLRSYFKTNRHQKNRQFHHSESDVS